MEGPVRLTATLAPSLGNFEAGVAAVYALADSAPKLLGGGPPDGIPIGRS